MRSFALPQARPISLPAPVPASFLIHSLRLSYLRNVEDPYGARLITFSPAAGTNPYIIAAGLGDAERWPELAAPTSPAPSDDERIGTSGFPGASSLRHTQTIMGPSRTGALGMRVSAKRHSAFRPRSARMDAPAPDAPRAAVSSPPSPEVVVNGHSEATSPQGPKMESPVKQVLFVPKFKGAAEMEARRRQRMVVRAQHSPQAQPPPPPPPANLNPEFSSSEEDQASSPESPDDASSDEDFGEVIQDGLSDMESDGDEFDPYGPPLLSRLHMT